jgi:hypothetical protein
MSDFGHYGDRGELPPTHPAYGAKRASPRGVCPGCGRNLDGLMATHHGDDTTLLGILRGEGEWWQVALLWTAVIFAATLALAALEAAVW